MTEPTAQFLKQHREELALYDQMSAAIAQCERVDEIKRIRDKVKAVEAYAVQARNYELENKAIKIRLRAERRAGQLLKEMKERGERRASKDGRPKAFPEGTLSKTILADVGMSRKQCFAWQKLAEVPEEKFEARLNAASWHKPSTRELIADLEKERKRSTARIMKETCSVADLKWLISQGKKFGCVYADPPWRYDNQATRGAVSDHYEDMSVDEICRLPIKDLAADNAHLHLWTTNAFGFDSVRIFEAWGFEFRSSFVWVKPSLGNGNYWRNSHEILLTAIRGKATSFNDSSLRSWQELKRGEHSVKPEEVRQMLERASPGPYLELFGRIAVEGWTVWGDAIEQNVFRKEVKA